MHLSMLCVYVCVNEYALSLRCTYIHTYKHTYVRMWVCSVTSLYGFRKYIFPHSLYICVLGDSLV